jgi:uncharacterized protein YbbK (DUF523 family)
MSTPVAGTARLHRVVVSACLCVFIAPYKGKKSGAFQEKWLRRVKWLNVKR